MMLPVRLVATQIWPCLRVYVGPKEMRNLQREKWNKLVFFRKPARSKATSP
jgi:hypothetical protein